MSLANFRLAKTHYNDYLPSKQPGVSTPIAICNTKMHLGERLNKPLQISAPGESFILVYLVNLSFPIWSAPIFFWSLTISNIREQWAYDRLVSEPRKSQDKWKTNEQIYLYVCMCVRAHTHTHTHTYTHTQGIEPAWIVQIVVNEIVDFLCEETFAGLCSKGSELPCLCEEWWRLCSLPASSICENSGWMLGLFTVNLLF